MVLLYVFFPELVAFAISCIAKNVSAVGFLPVLLLCSAVKLVYQYRIGFCTQLREWLLPAACFLYEMGQLMALFLGVDSTSTRKVVFLAFAAAGAAGVYCLFAERWFQFDAEHLPNLWKGVLGIVGVTAVGFGIFFINGALLNGRINDTYNWISVAGVSVQLSEIYKLFSVLMADLTVRAKRQYPWMLWVFCGYHLAQAASLCILREMGTAMQLTLFAMVTAFLLAEPYKQGEGVVKALQSKAFVALASAACLGLLTIVKHAVRWICYRSEAITLVGYQYQPPAGSKLMEAVVLLNQRINGLTDQTLAAHRALYEAPLFSSLNMRDYTAFHNADAAQFAPDYCFTVLCQVYGKLPVLLVLCLFLFAVMHILYHAVNHLHRSRSAAALASGIMMLLQILIHVLGPVRLMPFSGITLPFASLGGTSLVIQTLLLCFMLQSAREAAAFEALKINQTEDE